MPLIGAHSAPGAAWVVNTALTLCLIFLLRERQRALFLSQSGHRAVHIRDHTLANIGKRKIESVSLYFVDFVNFFLNDILFRLIECFHCPVFQYILWHRVCCSVGINIMNLFLRLTTVFYLSQIWGLLMFYIAEYFTIITAIKVSSISLLN